MLDYPESITITLRPKYNKIIREYCKQNNIPVSRFIKEIVQNYLNANVVQNDYII